MGRAPGGGAPDLPIYGIENQQDADQRHEIDQIDEWLRVAGLFPGSQSKRRELAELHLLGSGITERDVRELRAEAELRAEVPTAMVTSWIVSGDWRDVLRDLRDSRAAASRTAEPNMPRAPYLAQRASAEAKSLAELEQERLDAIAYLHLDADGLTVAQAAQRMAEPPDQILTRARRYQAAHPHRLPVADVLAKRERRGRMIPVRHHRRDTEA